MTAASRNERREHVEKFPSAWQQFPELSREYASNSGPSCNPRKQAKSRRARSLREGMELPAWSVTELQLGNVIYNQQELLLILRQPVRGNGLVLLAHQLIAAKLKIANGGDGSCIHQTLTAANSLIGDLVVPPVGNGYLQPKDVAGIAGVLGSYNEGNLCGPSCDNGSLSPSQAPRPHPIPAARP